MPPDPLQSLMNIPLDELRPIVCQVLGTEATPSGTLSTAKIGRSAGTATAGMFRVAGYADTSAGEQPWSAVVKVIGPSETRQQAMDAVAAHRELAVYRSSAFAEQHGGVRSPQCYAVQEQNELHFIWLEDLSEAPQPPWIPEYFMQTAHHFGRFNVRWPEQELPNWDWLSKDNFRRKYYAPNHHKSFARLSEFQKHPLISRALPPDVLQGLLQLWEERDYLLHKVEATPLGIAHGDCHPKNLFPLPDSGVGSSTVAFDWASVGIEPLGSDVGLLLASPVKWMELSLDEAAALVNPMFDAYMTGLTEAGWSGNADQVRRTYLTCLGTGEAIRLTQLIAIAFDYPDSHPSFEKLWMRPAEEIFEWWGEAQRFYLTYHHEALRLAVRQ